MAATGVEAPAWRGLYPFASHWLEVDGHRDQLLLLELDGEPERTWQLMRRAARDPAKVGERALRDLPPVDAALMEDPAMRAIHDETTAEEVDSAA